MTFELQVPPDAGQMRRARQHDRAPGPVRGTHRDGPEAGPTCDVAAVAAEVVEAPVAPGRKSGPFCPHPASKPKTMATASAAAADTLPARFPSLFMRGILVSTPPSAPAATSATRVPLTDAEYTRQTSALLAHIEATCDRWLDEDVIDVDTHRTGGLLELVFPDRSKIVINTQPPLQEMWLAARAGGFHYLWDGQVWRDTRDGHELLQMLSRQASTQAGRPLAF